MRGLVWAAALSLTILVGCVDLGTDGDSADSSDDAPHACIGASLGAQFDNSLDGELLAASIEAQLPSLQCINYRVRRAIECVPVDSVCGFEPMSQAVALESEFRSALASFDSSLEKYGYSVIDECFCRAY